MKVLRVINSLNPALGGPGQGIKNSINAQHKLKLDINNEVLCLDNSSEEYLTNHNFVIHAIGKGATSWRYHPKLISWLLKNLNNYDIVIMHGMWNYPSYAIYKALKILKLKNKKIPTFILMPHGALDPYFQLSNDRKWKSIRNKIYWKFFESKVVNFASALFFTTDEELLQARKSFSNYNPKLEINAGYGVLVPLSYNKISNDSIENLIRDKYILFLGRIHPKKGVDLIINAYQKLLNDGFLLPNLIIAGPTNNNLEAENLKTIVSNDELLKKYIYFIGQVNGDLKWNLIANAYAFILPSHQENFGISVVESLAFGVPVLISDKVNIYREILNFQAGFVEEDTEEGTIQLIKKICALDMNEIKSFSLNSRKLYESNYNADDIALNWYNIFKTLIK